MVATTPVVVAGAVVVVPPAELLVLVSAAVVVVVVEAGSVDVNVPTNSTVKLRSSDGAGLSGELSVATRMAHPFVEPALNIGVNKTLKVTFVTPLFVPVTTPG